MGIYRKYITMLFYIAISNFFQYTSTFHTKILWPNNNGRYKIYNKLSLDFKIETIPDPCIPETEKDRSTIDFPQEWITPVPSRRPDTFPEFDRLKVPLPLPMPGDPEMPKEEKHEKSKPPEENL